MKQIKLNKLKFGLKSKLLAGFLVLLLIVGLINALQIAITNWYETHTIIRHKPVVVQLAWPLEIVKREAQTQEVIRIIETIPAPNDLETDIEKKIYELWGIENYRIAIAVARAESNLNCNAFHINDNGSADFSIFQVNSLWIKNYSLAEVADCERNIEIAHEIWDRGDGTLGNDKGSWSPWVAAKNGAFLKFLE
jgi:hypothetical protein